MVNVVDTEGKPDNSGNFLTYSFMVNLSAPHEC